MLDGSQPFRFWENGRFALGTHEDIAQSALCTEMVSTQDRNLIKIIRDILEKINILYFRVAVKGPLSLDPEYFYSVGFNVRWIFCQFN
jgi:hypothetical protein